MLHFDSDYMEGAHPKILQRLLETNLEQTPGYGTDDYCRAAKEKILQACGCPEGQVYFLVGGTQTNATVIDAVLRSWQGVVAVDTGHIASHEAGAIEFGGHKVLSVPQADGKLTAQALRTTLTAFWSDANHEHMVEPGMVYISHPTESGSLYTRAELEALHQICREYRIPLFLDGARLGYGLMARNTDVDLRVISENCDAFYIGGTKVGALFGEAVVLTRPELVSHFFTTVKQHGGLLAKGRLLGLQFDTLFTDGLYFEISKHAIDMAEKLKEGFRRKGYRFHFPSPTNQQFFLMEDAKLAELGKQVSFGFWEKADETHTVVRFATSWATREEDVDALLELI